MRFAPAGLALSFALAMTASVGLSQERAPDPRAAMLLTDGRAAMQAGDIQGAVDAFEAALAVDPAYTPTVILLAEAARKDGLQGKAIRYYREALVRDPGNLMAISGEGAALVEKGAVEKARQNLAQLESLCGNQCLEAETLAAKIASGPREQVLTAEAVMPDAVVTQTN